MNRLICDFRNELWQFSAAEMRDCNTAINDAIRRIYSYQRWESTRFLRQTLGFPNIYEIFSRRSRIFLTGNMKSRNRIVSKLTNHFISKLNEDD